MHYHHLATTLAALIVLSLSIASVSAQPVDTTLTKRNPGDGGYTPYADQAITPRQGTQ
ncbi:hypothetical protein BDA99DRAFT_555023 [Phascolomyces articulosus]|uniref:Uncharacterized protein n=1 Tax=Phascolomyces articulosus TaxID=60185 RepID=A0AAD5KPY4_9FUNG|nr:hypothetical protein BDA99DRAFT_555023 [Phascolomyces articulosus]